jgi:sirohydrochlorin ferrochelatase
MGAEYVAGPALPTRSPGTAGPGLPARAPRGGAADGMGGPPLPSRAPGAENAGPGALPTRTSKVRRGGRHSSPYAISVGPVAPALVLAVPGRASDESAQVVTEIMDAASGACPGVEVRAGYLEGSEFGLAATLEELPAQGGLPSAVVVPLLAGPHPAARSALTDAVGATGSQVIVTEPLGPHPLLAEVMHMRLAEAGLARAGRAARISVGNDADGIIVLAAGGEIAVQSVGVVAVLLASRLAVPVGAAEVSDPAGVEDAAARLRDAHVTKLALAPCLVGPEAGPGQLAAISTATGLPCAAPLGAHAALGHLVVIRYGAALADPALAGLAN